MASKDIRAELARLMQATLADETAHHDWSYHAVRPMSVPPTWNPGQQVVGDCSKGVQYLCRWAGAPDPMANHFAPYGNSQTLWVTLQHLSSPGELFVGDIVTFGHDGNEHAAMVLERGADPLLWSFGHQGAPNSYRLSWDRREHQYLRLPAPAYVPTPQDKLRSRTGWFSWVAWRQGEGDWLHYGVSNKKVRPAVPILIPPLWWVRLGKFLAARNNGDQPTG